MDLITLMYHDIYRESTGESGFQTIGSLNYKIKFDQFENHLIKIRELIDLNPELTGDILFTFDDGGKSAYTIIAPLLKKYGFTGYFFITTDMIGKEGFCTENQIKELHKEGHIIGSHNHIHRSSTENCSSKQITDEWNLSSKIIEKIIGIKPACASLPNGFSDSKILKAIENVGFRKVFTSTPTTIINNRNGIEFIGRYSISATTSVENLKAIVESPFTRKKIEIRAYILSHIKNLLGSYYSPFKTRLLKLIYSK